MEKRREMHKIFNELTIEWKMSIGFTVHIIYYISIVCEVNFSSPQIKMSRRINNANAIPCPNYLYNVTHGPSSH